ncbi:MAG: hypothetical protein EA401_13960 [Planctomycetota bacterium]|nr:MAG: hypothetical protein EA401_13960 [Planctomycetota bacterium]
MAGCNWIGNNGEACPRQAHGAGTWCIWHNSQVSKRAEYVVTLLREELKRSQGEANGFHLQGLIWPQAQLADCQLNEADLRDCVLPDANMRGVQLNDSDCSRAQLSGVDLREASLRNADLSHAHLAGADLRGADLRGARINETVFLDSDLRGARLDGAIITSFTWNRFTRFQDVSGFDAPVPRGDTSDHETMPFPSPLAAANYAEGISSSQRRSLSNVDPNWSKTRVFRQGSRQQSVHQGLHALTPRDSTGEPDQRSTMVFNPRRHAWSDRRWWAAAAVVVAWAIGASLIAGYFASTRAESPPRLVEVPGERLDPPTTQSDDPQEAAFYLRQIQRRDAEVSQLRRSNEALNERLQNMDSQRIALQADIARLQDAADANVQYREDIRQLRRTVQNIGYHNRRLEETAEILVSGNTALQEERDQLHQQVQQRFEELEEVTRYRDQRDQALADLAELEEHLAHLTEDRNRLRRELERSSATFERFLTRLEGTGLEKYIRGEEDRGPLLHISPDRALTLGGDDLLLSLRVTPAERSGRVVVTVVMQRHQQQELPDLSIILYGEEGRALRRLGFSFPSSGSSGPFITAITEIDSPHFPTAARVSAARGLDDQWLSNR